MFDNFLDYVFCLEAITCPLLCKLHITNQYASFGECDLVRINPLQEILILDNCANLRIAIIKSPLIFLFERQRNDRKRRAMAGFDYRFVWKVRSFKIFSFVSANRD